MSEWTNEATENAAIFFSLPENLPFAMAEAKRHSCLPNTLGVALTVVLEAQRLVDDGSNGVYMNFTDEFGRNTLRDIDYDQLGGSFLNYAITEGYIT